MSSKVGLIAGDIWRFILRTVNLFDKIKESGFYISNTMLYLVLDWLSREDKIVIKQNKYNFFEINMFGEF
jgi:hypothetical protein